MKMKPLASLFALSLTLLCSLPTPVHACAWSEEWEGAYYKFFDPEYAGLDAYKPFHFTFERLYDYDLLDHSVSEDANVAAWMSHLGGGITKEQVHHAIYGQSLDFLISLQTDRGSVNLSRDDAANPILRDFKAGKRAELLDYLILAYQAQPLCNIGFDPWDEAEPVLEGLDEVLGAAQNAQAAAKDPVLKLRYAYQIMRLQQYGGRDEAAIETYERLVLPHADADRLIAGWCRSHYAGCLRNLELEAEAAYNFSRVFDECPSRRVQAWYGWRILSDDIWESVVAKCKTNHEKAVVHFLRAFSPESIAHEDMERMHALDPGSELLDVLLLREINKLENKVLGSLYSNDKPLRDRLAAAEGRKLADFVNRVLQSGKMHDRNVWELAGAYLQFLNGDPAGASVTLAGRQGSLTGPNATKGRLLDLVFKIANASKVDASVENAVYKDFVNLRLTDEDQGEREELKRFRDQALAWLYEAQGQHAKALLARDQAYLLTEYPIDIDLVNDMLAFEAKAEKTLYEKELLGRIGDQGGVRDQLLEIKGTGLLGRNLFAEAERVFMQIANPSNIGSLGADPFRIVTTDVVNCEDCGGGDYDKLNYVRRMMELEKKAVSDPSKAAEYYMLLGNGHYATSYFGAAWNARDYFRSSSGWYYLGEHSDYFEFNEDTFDEAVSMDLAKGYYEKALKASKDKEMAALAAFMMAKCELNQNYMDGNSGMPAKSFDILIDNYRKTKVYRELLKECWYLQSYAQSK